MFIGTHALLPVAIALGIDNVRIALGRDEGFPAWAIPAIGLAGALPDLCTPHLSLDARYTSWSHTMLFAACLLPVLAGLSTFFPKGTRGLVTASAWLAVILHLASDAVAGGICWLRPWRDDVLGTYYIHPNYWPASDAVFVLLTWGLLIVRRLLRGRAADLPARRAAT